jgi:hypothetical protein
MGTPPPLERRRAWFCLVLNALVCPGFGSLLAKRWTGLPQLGLALVGAGGLVWAMTQYLLFLIRLHRVPDSVPYLQTGLQFLALFLAGWFWSIVTGALLVRRSRPRLPPALPDENFPVP